jgi:hypothetical protein
MAKNDSLLRRVLTVRPSIRMEQLGSHWANFYEIWYLTIIWRSAESVQVSLKSDKNNRYFAWRPVYIYHSIWVSSS